MHRRMIDKKSARPAPPSRAWRPGPCLAQVVYLGASQRPAIRGSVRGLALLARPHGGMRSKERHERRGGQPRGKSEDRAAGDTVTRRGKRRLQRAERLRRRAVPLLRHPAARSKAQQARVPAMPAMAVSASAAAGRAAVRSVRLTAGRCGCEWRWRRWRRGRRRGRRRRGWARAGGGRWTKLCDEERQPLPETAWAAILPVRHAELCVLRSSRPCPCSAASFAPPARRVASPVPSRLRGWCPASGVRQMASGK
mmetsp:Transcript_20429/g.64035  ORF Transcript_20429/g.64035 Transcript_20429/m.64035 type:complete len:253 (+) Transcript_20429:756-1514(+)